ncbi:MAG: type I methionyl aminopeptidase [bacterium]
MAVTIKTPEEIEILREGGKRLAFIVSQVAKAVKPGVSTNDLNDLAIKLAEENGDKAAFLNYRPPGVKRAYPAAICVSVNDVIVHGIPNEKPIILKEGDIVSLDMGLNHKGLFTDHAVTVPVGKIDEAAQKLISVTKSALDEGIAAALAGNHVRDISYAIEKYVRPLRYGIVEELCGHGVGYKPHEDPYVPNYCLEEKGEKLKVGMVLAIEPMLNEGSKHIIQDDDDYTYRTADGKRSAHFEHTIVITKDGAEILTML